MKRQTFEDFLVDHHAKHYVGTDDDMVEDFDRFIESLDTDYMIKLADIYGHQQYILGNENMSNVIISSYDDVAK